MFLSWSPAAMGRSTPAGTARTGLTSREAGVLVKSWAFGRPGLIIFDLDGTLIDYNASAEAAYRQVFTKAQKRFGPLPVDRLIGLLRAADRGNWADYCAGRIPLEELWRRRWRFPLAALGFDADPCLLEALNSYYAAVLPLSSRLFPDALPCLEDLHKRFSLALLSNSPPRTAWSRLSQLGLGRFFAFIGIGGELGAMKPHPGAFRAVLETTGARPDTTAIVGDDYQEDMVGGRNAGLRTVWLRRNGGGLTDGDLSQVDAVVQDLQELRCLFREP
jgi:putative hydrolase of the HAD superfamily